MFGFDESDKLSFKLLHRSGILAGFDFFYGYLLLVVGA